MSILVLATQTQPTQIPEGAALVLSSVLIALTVASPLIARTAGVFRRGSVAGPSRLGAEESVLKFLGLAGVAVAALSIGGAGLVPLFREWPEPQRMLAAGMIGMAIAFVAVLVANASLRPPGAERLGLSLGGAARGVATGFVGMIVVLPWLFWLMIGLDALLRHYGIYPPTEHEIFRMWRAEGTGPGFRILSVCAAVIIAPLAEETLFRGVVQTGFVYVFGRLFARPVPPPLPGEGELVVSEEARPVRAVYQGAGPRWIAIVLTALMFAVIHQPWFIQPPIFILAIGLGYVYERTGNLWAAIFMHMFFNGLQFGVFLFVQGAV